MKERKKKVDPHHLDFDQGVVSVVEEVLDLARVQTSQTKKEMSLKTQGHWNLIWTTDGI